MLQPWSLLRDHERLHTQRGQRFAEVLAAVGVPRAGLHQFAHQARIVFGHFPQARLSAGFGHRLRPAVEHHDAPARQGA